MKPDRIDQGPGRAADDVGRAHLKEPRDTSHVMFRYDVPPELAGLARRFWVPVWQLPPGHSAPQKVLQYPVCLLVISDDYARFYGVTSGLSTTTLTGIGWAVGVMCEPAAGFLLAGESVHKYRDHHVDIRHILGLDVDALISAIRSAMATDPRSVHAHHVAMTAYLDTLRRFMPVDPEGKLVNDIVAFVENNSDVMRVSQVSGAFGVSERSLQRLVHRRLGLTPKWLIQRRRLHDAVAQLRSNTTTLAEVAAELGYADEPHFIRDFSRSTGMTPGQFAAQQRG